MRALVVHTGYVFCSLLLLGSASALAMQADWSLLSLVPQKSDIVVEAAPRQKAGQPRYFVLFTLANRIDYEDFLAVAAVDTALRIDRMIFTATNGATRETAEHSLIARGRFDGDHIRRSISSNQGLVDYRGVPVCVVPPVGRESSYFRQVRLLAILGSDLALFGTPDSVRVEIDRLLDGAAVDTLITQNVGLLNHSGDSWYLVRSPAQRASFAQLLGTLDSKLGDIGQANELFFGLRYGKRVELEYATASVLPTRTEPDRQQGAKSMLGKDGTETEVVVRIVRIERSRFEKWLELHKNR